MRLAGLAAALLLLFLTRAWAQCPPKTLDQAAGEARQLRATVQELFGELSPTAEALGGGRLQALKQCAEDLKGFYQGVEESLQQSQARLQRAKVKKDLDPGALPKFQDFLDGGLAQKMEDQALALQQAAQKADLPFAAPHWAQWRQLRQQNAGCYASQKLENFQVRYAGGENLNFAEAYLDDRFTHWWSQNNEPLPIEPIFRLKPAVIGYQTGRTFSLVEAGLNYYFFQTLLKTINPLGLAAAAGNPNAAGPFANMFDKDQIGLGVMAHAATFELGILWNLQNGSGTVVATFNYQLLAGVI